MPVIRGFGKFVQRGLSAAPIAKAIRSVWTPPASIYRHLPVEGRFTVEVAPGAAFQLYSDGYEVENELFWRGYAGSWEHASLTLWRELASKADFVVDVGANTGVYALTAQALNPKAKVVAVEPSARVFHKLVRNIRLNDYPIIAERVAASDQAGVVTFYDFPGQHQYSASLEPSMGGTIEVKVAAEPLDSILDRCGFPRIDLLKIDVERHEPAALRGMRRFLEQSLPTILIEVLDAECRAGVEVALAGLSYSWKPIADEEGRNFLLTAKR